MSARLPQRLAHELTTDERRHVLRELERLLLWARTVRGWPEVRWAPDATPFVSVYSAGRLVGCAGALNGAPRERLASAFVRAIGDQRFAALTFGDRLSLSAEVAFPRRLRRVSVQRFESEVEPGRHGLILVAAGEPIVLLPRVACDGRLDHAGLLDALASKWGHSLDSDALLYAFTVSTVSCAAGGQEHISRRLGPIESAMTWLAARVDGNGNIDHAVDPSRCAVTPVGEMHHGRAAIAIQALGLDPRHAATHSRARARLEADIRAGLARQRVPGWPERIDQVAGALALAVRAGIPVSRTLTELARSPAIAGAPWHAAQVAGALGASTPAALWRACIDSIGRMPWNPWLLLAADTNNIGSIREGLERAIIEAIRSAPPYAGAVVREGIPETALTALSVEALSSSTSPAARAARRRGKAFLSRWQFASTIPAALDPVLARGAFPAAPTFEILRTDVTAHAILALRR